MIKLVTHSGGFHGDDVFAIATLKLFLEGETVEVTRTRDEAVINEADWVVDVGGVFDPASLRFDHHQNGAPVRESGVPYAAFGLVWQQVGEQLCGGVAVAKEVESRLVLPIDAADNGVSLYNLTELNIAPATVSDLVSVIVPPRGSGEDVDAAFMSAVEIAMTILKNTIAHAKAKEQMKAVVAETFNKAADKNLLIFDEPVSKSLLINYPEVNMIVCPDDPATNQNWLAVAIPQAFDTFATRKNFPEAWAGLRDTELASVSGIADAVFCHKNRFLFVAGSKEGALAAASKAE